MTVYIKRVCTLRVALVAPVQVQVVSVSHERVERTMNEASDVYNPLPFSFINSKARVVPNCIVVITDIGPHFRVRPVGRSRIIVIIISMLHAWAPQTRVKNYTTDSVILLNRQLMVSTCNISN